MSYTVRDYRPDDLAEAERLAAMFLDFDSAWPGGFRHGARETGENVLDRKRRLRRLAVLVVEQDGELVGYCDLEAQAGQSDLAYIPLLGARLAHHGRGVGKMLLREMVRRVTAMNYKLLTLYTWSGNMKAVPLYKKTGFHWVPKTDVYMKNFLPSALTIPVGREFFAHRDWYACLEREIMVAPDDVTWKGMKVFPYCFRDGDDFLNLVFDATSEGLTAIEMPAFSLACSIPVEEAAAGETCPISWEITPRQGQTLDVALLVESDAGLELRAQERLRVDRQTVLARDLKISPDATPRREGQPSHRVRSTLLIDGQPFALETGVKVTRPIEIAYSGQGLFPNRQEKIVVALQSNLDKPLVGRLALDAHPALECEQPAQEFTLPPRLKTQCEFVVTARAAGVHATQVRFTAGDSRGERPIAFRAFGGPGALASVDATYDEMACLESPELRVEMHLRGGWMKVTHSGTERVLLQHQIARLGPPFEMDWEIQPAFYAARTETTDGVTRVAQAAPSQEHLGLTVERVVSVVGGNLIRVEYRVHNTSDQPAPAKLRTRIQTQLNGRLVYPTADGLLREPVRSWGEWPEGMEDVLAKGARLAENWTACEEEGLVCGLILPEEAAQDMQQSRMPNMTFDLGEIAPHSVRSLPPIYLVAGAGDWQTVRDWRQRLTQASGAPESTPPEPVRVLEVRGEPSPLLVCADRETVRLSVLNRRDRALNGTLTLTGDGFAAQPETFPLAEVNRDRPFTGEIEIAAPSARYASSLTAKVDSGATLDTFPIPILRLGTGGETRVTEDRDGQIVIENGHLTLRAAPHFFGALTALECEGVNHLFSSYPQERAFVYTNPWFGGIHPFLGWMGDARLPREKFTGAPSERTGERGLRWQGARMTCEPEQKELRWLRLETEYLTLPGSNVVALISRWTNRTDARAKMDDKAGFGAWLQVGGTRENAVTHWEREGEKRLRRNGAFSAEANSGKWTAVENARTGDFALLVATEARSYARFEDMGAEGVHLEATGPLCFEPNETRESVTWLVLGKDLSQLDAYAALAQLRRLP